MLSRPALNFITDFVALLAFVACMATAALLLVVFPPATSAEGWRLWGLDFDDWFRIHLASLLLLALLILLHVILHWPWVCSFVATRWARLRGKPVQVPPDGVRTIYGVLTLILLLILVTFWIGAAEFSVRPPSSQPALRNPRP